ncbi:hypothetical protein BDN67DRAFT_546437 [Paxillus ammoniavirescens]|nr:hypothetical protein BDN67DRAFT_546437 [Paxillus ammoniavirescens]
MHVKESVKEFVHDVKRRFSHHHKHNRGESSSSTHTHDGTSSLYSNADSHLETSEHSNPSSPASSQPTTPESSRFSTFIRPRTPSTPSKKHHHNVLHKIRRGESKRSRLFSTPSLPSGRLREGDISSSNHERVPSTASQGGDTQLGDTHREIQPPQLVVTAPEQFVEKPKSIQTVNEHGMLGSSQEDYADVNHITDSQPDTSESAVPEGESVNLVNSKREYDTEHIDQDESQPPQSDISSTLITTASGHEKSISESDSFEEVTFHSDSNPDHISSIHEESPLCHPSELPVSAVSTVVSIPEPPSDIAPDVPLTELESDANQALTSNPVPIAKDQPKPESMAQEPELPPLPPSKPVEDEGIPGPNPFVLDDNGDTGSLIDGKDRGAGADAASPLEEEIALAQSLPSVAPPLVPTVAPAVNLNKPTPSRPLSPPVVHSYPQSPRGTAPGQPTRTASGSPAPVYIPRLTAPSMFLPIPNTDPLSALLTKYVSPERRPRRDVTGEYQGRDVHEMVVSYLHKLSRFLPLRPTFTFTSFSRLSRTFTQRLHLSHTHPHYSVVSRICTRSFIILLSLSVLLSVRVHRFRFPRDWRVFSVLYSPSASVAKYY